MIHAISDQSAIEPWLDAALIPAFLLFAVITIAFRFALHIAEGLAHEYHKRPVYGCGRCERQMR